MIKNKETFKIEEWLKTNDTKSYSMPADKASKEATSDSIENGHALFKVKTSVDEEGNTVEEAVGTIGNLQDIVHDSKVWQWAGVGFGDYDSMLLQKSIKNLITAKGVS